MKNRSGFYFLGSVTVLYLALWASSPGKTCDALKASGAIFIRIIPVLFFVLLLMGLIDYFFSPESISRYLGERSGIRGWLLAISAGVLSHGPIYAWYPMLKDLRDKGMKTGLVAVFLYNRAIKIPLLPVLIYYFGVAFAAVLLVYMIAASVIEGKIIEITEKRGEQTSLSI